jgi:hypothetical protein
MFIVVLLGAVAHILIWGTNSQGLNGLRHRIVPGKKRPFKSALLMEFVYSASYVGFIALPYRMITNPTGSLWDLLLGRTLLPCLVFFFGMALFIGLKYPGSLRESSWIQVRGIVAGLLIMFCLCGGMFL